MVTTLILSIGTSYCQDQKILKFDDCKNYEDTCLVIGQAFIKKPSEAANKFKKWFYVEDPGKYEILDSKTEVMVDCLHIYYKIFRTYKGDSYNVEQQLYCEISAGEIQKLSLVCYGFRKVN